MYIKAMGNAASPKAMQQLKRILKDRTQALHTRVECVWAHRRIIREARETVSNLGPQDRTLVTNILRLQTVRVQRSVNVYISIMVLTYNYIQRNCKICSADIRNSILYCW